MQQQRGATNTPMMAKLTHSMVSTLPCRFRPGYLRNVAAMAIAVAT